MMDDYDRYMRTVRRVRTEHPHLSEELAKVYISTYIAAMKDVFMRDAHRETLSFLAESHPEILTPRVISTIQEKTKIYFSWV